MALPPHRDPGRPDIRGPGRYLWWAVRMQPGRAVRAVLFSCLWLGGLVLEPLFIRGAIDHGLVAGELAALVRWTATMAGVAVVTAALGMLRHRTMTFLRVDAGYRTVQLVTRQVARLGAALPRRVATGEVVTVGSTDIWHIAESLTVVGPGVGSVFAVVALAALVVSISPLLGILVLAGVPVVAVAVGPLLGRLRRSETAYRQQQGELTARAGDIVAGLRVLRGIGGEALFAGHYRRRSQALRAEGYRVGAATSWVRSLASGLPALFVAAVTWLAARMVAQGTLSVGDLVAVYAYAAILAVPVSFLMMIGQDLVRGLVAARRVVDLLALRPDVTDRAGPGSVPEIGPSDLHDPDSGLRVPAGTLLAVAAADPGEVAALADRLGRYVESGVTLGGAPLVDLPLPEVRRRILVAEPESYLFAGTLRDMLAPLSEVDDQLVERCLRAAAAGDIVDGLPDGLGSPLGNQARTLSGGQRQRVRLARALLADPEVLILLDPTSAVDAHTEAAVADRLRAVRTGRSTVVATTSPLLLDRADMVAYLADGRVAATGTHEELLAGCSGYRGLVVRGADDTVAVVP
jgi:ABC-type multidrug transport system fused ATPase/permease subunit